MKLQRPTGFEISKTSDPLPKIGEVWRIAISSWYLRKIADISSVSAPDYDYTEAPGSMFHPGTTLLIVRSLPANYPQNKYFICLIDEELYCVPENFFREWEKVLETSIKDNEYPVY